MTRVPVPPAARPVRARMALAALVVAAALPALAGARPAAAAGIAFRSAAVGTGSTLTVPRPGGAAPGDVLVAGIAKHEFVRSGIRAPEGWRLVTAPEFGGHDVQLAVYVRAVGSSEPDSYTWQTSDPAANGAVLAYSGVHGADPVVTFGAGGADDDRSSIEVPSLQVPVPGTVLVLLAMIEGSTPNPITPPGGFTERVERAVHPTIEGADAPFGGTGGTGPRVATAPKAGNNAAVLLSLRPAGSAPPAPPPAPPPNPPPVFPLVGSYWLAAADGGVFAFGDARFFGSTGHLRLARPAVGIEAGPSGRGYWLVAADGGVFAFGDARFLGSTGNLRLNRPIVAMVATPSGRGYWLAGADGGVFAFGDARFLGSTGNLRLNRPIVAMAATPSGRGYWLVAADGGVFAFGDAAYRGSTGALRLNRPIVALAPTASGGGYWLVASDGGVFAFGDAVYRGSTGMVRLAQPVVGASTTPTGRGYWLVASDGGVFAFGDAAYRGSTGVLRLARPMVGIAGRPPG